MAKTAREAFPNEAYRMRCLSAESPELGKVRALQLCLLAELDRLCRLHNLHYVMLYELLLSAVLKKDLLLGQMELSIGMPRGDYERFLQLVQEKEGERRYQVEVNPISDMVHVAYFTAKRTVFGLTKPLLMDRALRGIGLSLYPIDEAMGDAVLERKRLRRIIRANMALLLKRSAIRHHRTLLEQSATLWRPFGLSAMSLRLQAWWPKLFLQRQLDRALFEATTTGEASAVYLPMMGLTPASYFSKFYVEPSTPLAVGRKQFRGPGKTDPLLRLLYGDYRQYTLGAKSLELRAFYIDELYWADVLNANEPSGII